MEAFLGPPASTVVTQCSLQCPYNITSCVHPFILDAVPCVPGCVVTLTTSNPCQNDLLPFALGWDKGKCCCVEIPPPLSLIHSAWQLRIPSPTGVLPAAFPSRSLVSFPLCVWKPRLGSYYCVHLNHQQRFYPRPSIVFRIWPRE